MAVRKILQLGHPDLHRPADDIRPDQIAGLTSIEIDLRDTLLDFRQQHNRGRAIAAPQIGVGLAVIYLHRPEPTLIVNPRLDQLSHELYELWDDCMSFPGLFVRVRRHLRCRLSYSDRHGQRHSRPLDGSMSELLQHECDHLRGILATQRAIDDRSFSCGPPDSHLR